MSPSAPQDPQRPKLARQRKPEPPPGTPEHEEWLVDEAAEESFPASDASSTANPGSTLTVNKIADAGRETQPTEEQLKNKDEGRK